MQPFIQFTPTEIIFGADAQDQTADLVKKHGGSKVMIVYGKGSVEKSGLLDKITAQLSESGIASLSMAAQIQTRTFLLLVMELKRRLALA